MTAIARCRVNPYVSVNDARHCARVSAVVANNDNPDKCRGCPSAVKYCAACVRLSSNPLTVASAGEEYCAYHRTEKNRTTPVPNRQRFSDYEPMSMNERVREKIGEGSRAIHAERQRLEAAEQPTAVAPIAGSDDTKAFDLESASAYVRDYLKAPRHQKPSVWRMYEAIIFLVETVDPSKRRVAVVARAAGVPGDNAQFVITKFLSLGSLIESGRDLVKHAEAMGKRISLDWLATTAASDRKEVQPLAIRAKAQKLGVKL